MMSLYKFLIRGIKLLQSINRTISIAVRCKAQWIGERIHANPCADRLVPNRGELEFVSCRITPKNSPIIPVNIARRSPEAQRRERIKCEKSGDRGLNISFFVNKLRKLIFFSYQICWSSSEENRDSSLKWETNGKLLIRPQRIFTLT